VSICLVHSQKIS